MRIHDCTKILSLTVCIILSSCSTANISSMPENFQVSETALYLKRSNMNSTDFEQYKFTRSRMFQECGVIRSGRHIPTHQELFDVTSDKQMEINQAIWSLLELTQQGTAQVEDPGSKDSMVDPGLAVFKINSNQKTLEIKTSVDGIADPTTPAAKQLEIIFRSARGIGKPTSCGNTIFYGIKPS